jgi:hypothetical protein
MLFCLICQISILAREQWESSQSNRLRTDKRWREHKDVYMSRHANEESELTRADTNEPIGIKSLSVEKQLFSISCGPHAQHKRDTRANHQGRVTHISTTCPLSPDRSSDSEWDRGSTGEVEAKRTCVIPLLICTNRELQAIIGSKV